MKYFEFFSINDNLYYVCYDYCKFVISKWSNKVNRPDDFDYFDKETIKALATDACNWLMSMQLANIDVTNPNRWKTLQNLIFSYKNECEDNIITKNLDDMTDEEMGDVGLAAIRWVRTFIDEI